MTKSNGITQQGKTAGIRKPKQFIFKAVIAWLSLHDLLSLLGKVIYDLGNEKELIWST
jgi:hypothetical protein